MNGRTTTGLIAAALLASPTHAEPERPCAQRDVVIERLASAFGETRQTVGLAHNNALVEVFASEDTGTWTITMTSAQGVTCLIASGQAFEWLEEDLLTADQDA